MNFTRRSKKRVIFVGSTMGYLGERMPIVEKISNINQKIVTMKTLIRIILLILLAVQLPSLSQGQTSTNPAAIRKTMRNSFPSEAGGLNTPLPQGTNLFHPLPASVLLPSGLDSMPVEGTWDFQSNSRALHNIQIDPSNSNNIHAVITGTTNISGTDPGSLTRRCFYTFSSDAGKHWTTPVILSKFRSGYADMQLFERNNQWVPVIAAHQYTNAAGTETISSLWVEKGNPGDGNFANCLGSSTTLEGIGSLIIWPCIAVSPDSKSVYMISSVSPATTSSGEDQLQFGVWSLGENQDTAIFQGWTAEPGSTDNTNPDAGITSGGTYRIEVSQSGHIGVMWLNTEPATSANSPSPDGSIYFSESTDGGNTWSSSIPYIVEGANLTERLDASGNYLWTPSGSLDFWYDGDQPHFMYVGDFDDASNNTYLPYSTEIYYVPDAVEGDSIAVANATLNVGGSPGSGEIPSILNLSSDVIDMQELPIAWPTVARTTDSNHFSVFYQTHIEGDTEVFVDDTGTVIFAYSSIFYSSTLDGGQTWSDPQPFMVNASGASQKFDYRFPMVSYLNPSGESGITYHCAFAVDSAAGHVDSVGQPGFDVIGYGHATASVSFSGVSNANGPTSVSTSSYPNPFTAYTTINFTLPSESNVLLTVTDVLGRSVATLVNGRLGVGEHSSVFSPQNLADGVYRYTLQANGVSISGSMTLVR